MSCSIGCLNCTAEKRLQEFTQFRDKMKALTTFSYDEQEHSKPINIMLSVTDNCNLACPYCFVQQHPKSMTYEVAEQAVQWVLKNAQEKQIDFLPSVNFFGGEPLLEFNSIIKPLVEKYYGQVEFNITTNGMLLNEDIVDSFNKYNITPLLSLDGCAEVQNYQRPAKNGDSFQTILRNIPYLLLRRPNTIMRATLTKHSIPYLYENVLMAEELGFKKVVFCPNCFEEWTKEDENKLAEQLDKIALYIYKQLRQGEKMPILVDPLNKMFSNISQATMGNIKFNNHIMRCGLGTTTCAITTDGKIVPCQEKTSCPTTILGDIKNGINPNLHQKYLNEYFSAVNQITCDKGCNERERLLCLAELCPSRLEDLNYQISTAHCGFIRMATKYAAKLHFLCSHDINPMISTYFEEGGGILNVLDC